MRVSAFIGSVLAAVAWGTVAQADWMTPTSDRDCILEWQTQHDRMLAAGRAASQCYYEAAEARPFAQPLQGYGPVCLDRHGQTQSAHPECATHAETYCEAGLEADRRRDICRARLADHRARQAALRAQQEELQRLQQTQGAAAGQNGIAALIDRIGTEHVADSYLNLTDGPQSLVDDVGTYGARIAGLFGVRPTGPQGAHTLSAAMTEVGTEIMVRLNARALEELEAALGAFDANNPRPTAEQLEAILGQRAELAGQYAQQMTRVQNTDYRLPLGDESAVIGPYADAIVQLVEMRNAGEIDTPLALLGAGAATVLAAQAYREAEARAAEQTAPALPLATPAGDLRDMRQSLLAPLREERARIEEAERQAELERQNALALAERDARPAGSTGDARSCLEWATPERRSVRNTCDRPVWCLNASDMWAEYIPAEIATRYLTRTENGFPTGNAPNGRMVFMGGSFMAWPEDLRSCGFTRGSAVPQPVAPYVAPAQTAEDAFRNLGGGGSGTGSGSLQ